MSDQVKRMTFVGIAPCGHASYLAQDPATYGSLKFTKPQPRPDKNKRGYEPEDDVDWLEQQLDEYSSLVDSLRYYAQHGQIKLVTDEELGPYVDGMKNCQCDRKAG